MEGLNQWDEELFNCGLCGSQARELKAPGIAGRGVCAGRSSMMEEGERLYCSGEEREEEGV